MVVDDQKTCRICGVRQSRSEFYKTSGAVCKQCKRERQKSLRRDRPYETGIYAAARSYRLYRDDPKFWDLVKRADGRAHVESIELHASDVHEMRDVA